MNSFSSRRTWLIPLVVLILSACQGTEGCDVLSGGCEGGIEAEGIRIGGDYEFPRDNALSSALNVYVTDEGFSFIESNALELVAALLEQSSDEIDLSDFISDYLAENPIELFSFSIREVEAVASFPDGAESIDITVLDNPTRLNVVISRFWVSLEATVFDDDGTVTSACRVAPDAEVGGGLQSLVFEDIEVDVILGTTSTGELELSTTVINLGLEEIGIGIIDDENDPDYYCNIYECQDGCTECHIFCGGADLLLNLADFLSALFEDVIDTVVESIANQLLSGVQSVQGELHPGLLLGNVMPTAHDANWFGFLMAPGRRGFDAVEIPGVSSSAANDLRLSLSGGTTAEAHECVGKSQEQPTWSPPISYSVAAGDVRPHLVLSLADTFADQFVWSAYQSGVLCIQFGSSSLGALTDSFELNAGLLSLLLPGLDRLAEPDAPLLITVQPVITHEDFPLVRLGDSDLDESLLEIELRAVDIGLYAWVHGRYVRLFEIRTSVSVGVTLVVLPENELQIAIDSLEAELIEERYNELFVGVELTELINLILNMAVGLLVDGDIDMSFSLDEMLSGIMGIPVDIVVDRLEAAGADSRWLELALRLEEGSVAPRIRQVVDTSVEVEEVAVGEVALHVSAPGYPDERLEYQVRWGFGAWSGFRPAGRDRLRHSYLQLPGQQPIEVRARVIGDYRSLDLSPALVFVDVPTADSAVPQAIRPLSRQPVAAADDPPLEEVACQTSSTSIGLGWFAILAVAVLIRRRRPHTEEQAS